MGLTQRLGTIPLAIQTDTSNNVGIGGAANASFKLQVTGATNLTGALTGTSGTFSGNLEVFNSGAGQTAGDFIVNPTTKYVYVGRQSTTSGDNTTFVVRDRTGTARATIPGGGSIDTVFSTNSSNFKITNYSGTDLLSISNTGAATFSSSVAIGGAGMGLTGINMPNQNYLAWYVSGGSGAQNVAIRGNGNNLELSSGGGLTMTMDASQRVGIGTSSPNQQLTLKVVGSANSLLAFQNTAGSATTYFGIPNATGDVISTSGVNDTCLRNESGNILFATNGNTERMRITSGGNVLIGQSSPSLSDNGWYLQGGGGGHTSFAINNNEAFIFNNRNTGTTYEIDFRTNSTERGKISVTDSGVSYITTPSDLNLKKNFESWDESVLDVFKNLNPQKFNFIVEDDEQPKTKGFIAQELVDYFPEAYPKSKNRYFFNPSGMVVYLMKAIQEQQAQIEELRQIVATK